MSDAGYSYDAVLVRPKSKVVHWYMRDTGIVTSCGLPVPRNYHIYGCVTLGHRSCKM